MATTCVIGQDAIICLLCNPAVSLSGGKYSTIFPSRFAPPAKLQIRPGGKFEAFASRNSKKLTKERKTSKIGDSHDANSKDQGEFKDEFPPRDASYLDVSNVSLDATSPVSNPSRSAVLQACILTSGAMLALGAFIRQASHIAFTEGWIKLDSNEISFHFEVWHLELIAALLILISSSRYVLLNTWPDFSKSSEVANQQVLSSLELTDYIIVACLPGISEELLFRGGLLPLFGFNWIGALAAAVIFGCLHLSGGRKYSFAIWAMFVGFVYGMATIISSSLFVPMASHSLNNLIGGILWRYKFTLLEKSNSS